MNGINYTTALNHTVQLSQTSVTSRFTPLLKAMAVITIALIAIAAVSLVMIYQSRGQQTRPERVSTEPDAAPDEVSTEPETINPIPIESLSGTDKKIQIMIKTLKAETFYLQVYPSSKISELQQQICEYYRNLGDPRSSDPRRHRLLYRGQDLQPANQLNDYGITGDNSMIYLAYRTCR